MRETRQSGSEGREARKRAFLTPIDSRPFKRRRNNDRREISTVNQLQGGFYR